MHKLPVGRLDLFSAEHITAPGKTSTPLLQLYQGAEDKRRELRRTPKTDEDMTEFGVGCGIRHLRKADQCQLFQGLGIQKDVIKGSGRKTKLAGRLETPVALPKPVLRNMGVE